MNEDQIKAIAEKIADENYSNFGDDSAVRLMAGEYEDVLSNLIRDYCIVDKKKAAEAYEAYKMLSEKHPRASERNIAKIVAKVLADLLGDSMFNQDEE